MANREICYRLPFEDWPRAVFETDYGFRGGRLVVEGRCLLAAPSRESLLAGAEAKFRGETVHLRLRETQNSEPELLLTVGNSRAPQEDRVLLRPSRSAWTHAFIALGASFFGFVASYLYLDKSTATGDAWALKMALHMAGWHLLLTLTLFPASVWGQRIGIRSVQVVSGLFFLIHLGIAIANFTDGTPKEDLGIAILNSLSGVLFLVSVIYGQVAFRDMDPLSVFKAKGLSPRPPAPASGPDPAPAP